MDPRHPELAVSRMRELMEQYDRIEKEMSTTTTSAGLGMLEREASLVIQEICLVAPRLHESMMQTSRKRRYDLTHIYVAPEPVARTADVAEKVEETYVAPNQAETVIVEPKPRKKKKTTKKKAA